MSINLNIYQEILSNIGSFKKKADLLVVSKNRSLKDIMPCILEEKHRLFGENRIQEAEKKFVPDVISNFDISLHLIGPLQTNKVDKALSLFNTIQTVDRPKLVNEIYKSIQKQKFPIVTQNFYLQVNIGNEPQKSGILVDELLELYDKCLKFNLNIIGLMCIPPANVQPDPYFEKMLILRDDLNPNLKLSMGMSNDYEVALKFNSDIVRIGSLLFS
ncbi:YggS family pyridoxal phosphate-dependent enzyme [bacterium]|nr:YggS family pyridoxal phosphate-dependent enzyme [bacterium]